jgi:UDP-3-O-[3-hydroxymyristoyl] N-acetylglucosamine deacetylase
MPHSGGRPIPALFVLERCERMAGEDSGRLKVKLAFLACSLQYALAGEGGRMNQQTVARPVNLCGVGLHSGQPAVITILPAEENTGIRFRRTDLPGHPEVPARPQFVGDTALCTELRAANGAHVSTVEHLMAALWGAGIDNAVVEVEGREVPIMDGSAWPFLERLIAAGVTAQRSPRVYARILKPVRVKSGCSWVSLVPDESFSIRFAIDFKHPAIGHQELDLSLDEAAFRRQVARARTFGFMKDVAKLHSNGLARGGSLDNVVLLGDDRILNPEGLRFPGEFVRHKMLDAVGDLYLFGLHIIGRFEGYCSGHALSTALLSRLLGLRGAWQRELAPMPPYAIPAPELTWNAGFFAPAV